MIISFTYPASPAPPLSGCDCAGAVVYVKLRPEHKSVTRDGHGVVRATLVSRSQTTTGTWTYSFDLDESGLVSPLPAIGGGMVESVCCQGCAGYAGEAYNQDQFGAVLAGASSSIPAAGVTLDVQHMIRAFHLEDWRAWVAVAPGAAITMHLYAGPQLSVQPLVIPAGSLVSDRSFSFIDGRSCRIEEDSLVQIRIVTTDVTARGLEVQFFGHLNPSVFFSPHVAQGTAPVETVDSYEALLVAPIGSEWHSYPYVYKKTSFGVLRMDGATEFPIP